jgi:hypothetical protein
VRRKREKKETHQIPKVIHRPFNRWFLRQRRRTLLSFRWRSSLYPRRIRRKQYRNERDEGDEEDERGPVACARIGGRVSEVEEGENRGTDRESRRERRRRRFLGGLPRGGRIRRRLERQRSVRSSVRICAELAQFDQRPLLRVERERAAEVGRLPSTHRLKLTAID